MRRESVLGRHDEAAQARREVRVREEEVPLGPGRVGSKTGVGRAALPEPFVMVAHVRPSPWAQEVDRRGKVAQIGVEVAHAGRVDVPALDDFAHDGLQNG
eukprot:3833311-Lingulodinium_polyedra.AAC.1